MSKSKVESYTSIWDAIADTSEEAASLHVRSEFMDKISEVIEARGWTQAEATTHCGVTQPRINDLLCGRVSRFSLDSLVNIAAALGCRVHVEFEAS
jgi:predicted XRE-type DNA-binding protein